MVYFVEVGLYYMCVGQFSSVQFSSVYFIIILCINPLFGLKSLQNLSQYITKCLGWVMDWIITRLYVFIVCSIIVRTNNMI